MAPGDPTEFFTALTTGSWTDPTHPAQRVGNALRRLSIAAIDGRPSDDELHRLADRLEAIDTGGPSSGSRYRPEDRPPPRTVLGLRANLNGSHPLVGPGNVVAPPLTLRRDGEGVEADVTYDLRFEGIPGLVQGGFIAAAFDIVLAQAVALGGYRGMTGSMSVRFVSPTPLNEPLRYEARLDRAEGRKSFSRGRLVVVADGRVCAEGDAVFINPLVRPLDRPVTGPSGAPSTP